MSLYVGRLSPHIQPEELERVFRRFGRCNLQLKDGYGFVVYEVSANAERALRELRGRNICGEPISLNWSNRQPRPSQRSARPTRFYEPYRGRNFREKNDGIGIKDSYDRRDYSRLPAFDHGRHQDDDVLHKEAGHAHDDIVSIGRERGASLKEGVIDEGDASQHSPVENDRWREHINDMSAGHEMENGGEFDRYEPYHGDSKREEKENNQAAASYCSPDGVSSQGKRQREHSVDELDKTLDKSKPQLACYNCGLVGHIKRNCPEGNSGREKFNKYSHHRDERNFKDRGPGRLKMLRSNLSGRPNASRDPFMLRRHARDRKESHSGKIRSVRRSENSPDINNRPKLRAEAGDKKRSKEGHGTQKKFLKKRRTARLGTSSLSSDSSATSSQLHSLSLKSNSAAGSRSGSRSASSRSRSASISSSSASISSYSKSKRSRFHSRSRSRSRSPSLSVSLGEKPPSSKDMHTNISTSTLKENLDHVRSPDSKHFFIADSGSFKPKFKDELIMSKVDNETNGKHSGNSGNDAQYFESNAGCKESSASISMPKDAAASENCGARSNLQEALPVNPNLQIPVGCEGSNSSRITASDMFMVLKHCGLPVPGEGESNVSVREHFGAARLWPWEMIYHRRLKKGPITTENYARRVEQNKEFGIVDKYIRSSSGWGEFKQTA